MPPEVERALLAYIRARHAAGMCSQSLTCRRKAAPGFSRCAHCIQTVRRIRGVEKGAT